MSNDPTFAFDQAQEEACRIAAREDWQSRHGETFWDHSPADWDAMKAAVETSKIVKEIKKNVLRREKLGEVPALPEPAPALD